MRGTEEEKQKGTQRTQLFSGDLGKILVKR